jgi:hypothetical protein
MTVISEDTCKSPTESEYECTICRGDFNIDTEGGVVGDIGILPVQFCPTCLAGLFDMVTQMIKAWDDDDSTQ